MGRATAIRLARDFEAVALTARQEDQLKKTAPAVESAGAEPLTYPLDLRRASVGGDPLRTDSRPLG